MSINIDSLVGPNSDISSPLNVDRGCHCCKDLYPVSDIFSPEVRAIQVLKFVEDEMNVYAFFKSLVTGTLGGFNND